MDDKVKEFNTIVENMKQQVFALGGIGEDIYRHRADASGDPEQERQILIELGYLVHQVNLIEDMLNDITI